MAISASKLSVVYMNGWLSCYSDSVLIVPYTTVASETKQNALGRVHVYLNFAGFLAALPFETLSVYLLLGIRILGNLS